MQIVKAQQVILTVGFILILCVNAGCNNRVWNGNYTIENKEDLLALSGYTSITDTVKSQLRATILNMETGQDR